MSVGHCTYGEMTVKSYVKGIMPGKIMPLDIAR